MSSVDVTRAPASERAPRAEVAVRWWTPPAARADRRLAVLAGVAVAVGTALRLWSPSALWLDEAQAVAIARLPLGEMIDALRQDGAPPLYYFLLHAWIGIVGDGDDVVRLLSSVFAVAALPLAWQAGTAVGGRRTALTSTALVAASPFAIRYATEARMYSFVTLLVLAGMTLLLGPDRPVSRRRWLGLTAVTGALLLTHYWSFFLLAAVGALLAARAIRLPAARRASLQLLSAMAAGALVFLPWVPSFLFQVRHTGAPWGAPPGTGVIELAVRGFAWAYADAGRLLEVVFFVAVGGAVVAALSSPRRSTTAAALVGVCFATLALGAVAMGVTGDGFAPRHATVAFPVFVVAVAAVVAELRPPARLWVLGLAVVFGFAAAVPAVAERRTQAPAIAAMLRAEAVPGDVVAICPDQLAPALMRLLPPSLSPSAVFPHGSAPQRVDWTDYSGRVAGASPATFARRIDALAGSNTVWLVSSSSYADVGRECLRAQRHLATLRPATQTVVWPRRNVVENARLLRAPAPLPSMNQEGT